MHAMAFLLSWSQLLASILVLVLRVALAWLAFLGFWGVRWSLEALTGLMTVWDKCNTAFAEWVLQFTLNGLARADEMEAMGATWKLELLRASRIFMLRSMKWIYFANEWSMQRIARNFRPCQGRCKSHEQIISIT